MPSKNRPIRSRSGRYPRTWLHEKTGQFITVKNSDMDYIERVKQYVDLKGVTNREDLIGRLSKKSHLLGSHRQYKQINILAKHLNLTVRGKVDVLDSYTMQTMYTKNRKYTIYRDKKTGRFIKKPKEKK